MQKIELYGKKYNTLHNELVKAAIIPELVEVEEDNWRFYFRTQEELANAQRFIEEFEAKLPAKLKEQAIAALDAEYDPQFEALTVAWATAFMDGQHQIAEARLMDKQALRQKYEAEKEAILNEAIL